MEREVFFNVLNKALLFFSKGAFAHEFSVAKSDFFENSGVLDEQSPNYLVRVQQFLDWYFFSRVLNDFRLPPSHCVFMLPDLRWSPEESEVAGFLKDVKHTLIEVLKVKDKQIAILDILNNQKYELALGHQALLFSKGQIFDGRLLVRPQATLLLEGRCFHPEEATPFLISESKRHIKDKDLDRERFLLATLKMRYLAERYPNAQVEQIYNWKNRWIENEFSGS